MQAQSIDFVLLKKWALNSDLSNSSLLDESHFWVVCFVNSYYKLVYIPK